MPRAVSKTSGTVFPRWTYWLVNKRYVYFYSSVVKGMIVIVNIYKLYFDSEGKHCKGGSNLQTYLLTSNPALGGSGLGDK